MAKLDAMKTSGACPCGSNKNYVNCCGIYLDSNTPAPSAETLMRSRYTAYTLLREDYILSTWHISTRPAQLGLADETAGKWLGLEVKRHLLQDDDHAIVEFVARHKINGRAVRLQEYSHFVRVNFRWFYVDGKMVEKQ